MHKLLVLVNTFFILFSVTTNAYSQPSNNLCSSITTINPTGDCSPVSGNLYSATQGAATSPSVVNPTSTCGNSYDVWYKFTVPAAATSVTISVSLTSSPSSLTTSNTFIEVFNTSDCNSVATTNTLGCQNISSSRIFTGLTSGATYIFRVFTTLNPNANSTQWGFTVCVTSNDNCATAKTLTLGSGASGSVWGATASSSIPTDCATGTPDDDVWFKFVATGSNVNVDLSGIGTNLSAAGAMLQLLSGTTCTSLTSLTCGFKSLSASGLSIGSTYYIRVYSSDAGSIGGTASGSAFTITASNYSLAAPTSIGSSPMSEVFQQTILSPSNMLNDPWEVTYGPDGYLWITEAKGYRVFRMDPVTGLKSTILDISQNSSFLPSAERTNNIQFDISSRSFQGGLAGLALHPDWATKKFVYISYGRTYDSTSVNNSGGIFFTNRIVRFEYDPTTNRLKNPISVCDTLPGSSDHNSQRMIIAPVGGVNYLFYAAGDMGAGQFGNAARPIRAQVLGAYEGKILRFNLEDDGDGGLDGWIPNNNPFNTTSPAKQSAVWCLGIRNNQGFVYANGKLYGSSHGPYSDDEINIIEREKNYGHPEVVGFADGNYNNSKAGHDNKISNGPPKVFVSNVMPLITNEVTKAASIANYADPIFSAYVSDQATIYNIWNRANTDNSPIANKDWPSEGWSGMDCYSHSLIPGWKNSLTLAALKWGRLLRLKLNSAGTNVIPTAGKDTVPYFDSRNRVRDLAFSPNGKDIYVVVDKSSMSSGPTEENDPGVPDCPGCVFKYSFLGYNDISGKSSIPAAIDITTSASTNTIINGTTITIDATNNNLWVPITGPDGNILAEIKANGNNLGTVTSTFYLHSGAMREDANKRLYMNRSITINPQNQPAVGNPVNVRFYVTASELTDISNASNSQGMPSGVSTINNIRILKNNDANPTALTAAPSNIIPTYADPHSGSSLGGHVLQANGITSFSSFYFGNPSMTVLPLELVNFKATAKGESALVTWETEHEVNTDKFSVERSIDGRNFEAIGEVKAKGETNRTNSYSFVDQEASKQASLVYYRLKMLDKDGGYQYSKVVTVAFEKTNISIYPNPIKNVLNIQLDMKNSDEVKIVISDIQGRVVYSESKVVRTGVNDLQINTSSLAAQSYTVQVRDGNNKLLMSQKVVKR